MLLSENHRVIFLDGELLFLTIGKFADYGIPDKKSVSELDLSAGCCGNNRGCHGVLLVFVRCVAVGKNDNTGKAESHQQRKTIG